jgi:hypothetical protein
MSSGDSLGRILSGRDEQPEAAKGSTGQWAADHLSSIFSDEKGRNSRRKWEQEDPPACKGREGKLER